MALSEYIGGMREPEEPELKLVDPVDESPTMIDPDEELGNSLAMAKLGSPAQASQAMDIANRLEVSGSVVESDIDGWAKIDNDRRAEADIRSSDLLKRAFSNPEFAKIAFDDVHELSLVESAVASSGRVFKGTGTLLGEGLYRTWLGMQEAAIDMATPGRDLTPDEKAQRYIGKNGIWNSFVDMLGEWGVIDEDYAEWSDEKKAEIHKEYKESEARGEAARDPGQTPLERDIQGGFVSLMEMGIIVAATKGKAGGMTTIMGGRVAAESYGKAKAMGLSEEEAEDYALLQGAAEMIFSAPTNAMLGHLIGDVVRGRLSLKGVALFLGSEQIEEHLTSITQTLTDYNYGLHAQLNESSTIEEWLAVYKQLTISTAVSTLVATSGMGASLGSVNAITSRSDKNFIENIDPKAMDIVLEGIAANKPLADIAADLRKKDLDVGDLTTVVPRIQKVMGRSDKLDDLATKAFVSNFKKLQEAVKGSKTYQRSKSELEWFVEQAVEKGADTNFDISLDGVRIYAQNLNVPVAEVLADFGVAYDPVMQPEAVTISAEKIASGADSKYYDGIIQNARYEKNAPTYNEVEQKKSERSARSVETIAKDNAKKVERAKKVLEKRKRDKTFVRESQEVTESFRARAVNAGATEDVADNSSLVYGSFFTTLADELGISPMEAMSKFPLRIQGEGEVSGRSLDQFAGMHAQGADIALLVEAKRMEDAGETKTATLEQTGWFKMPDGMWRFEISDDAAKFNEDFLRVHGTVKLGNLLNHPKLFQAYPEIADYPVSIVPLDKNTQGYIDSHNHIHLNEDQNDAQLLTTILHEIQHSIQKKEGFAKGGGTLQFELARAQADREIKAINIELSRVATNMYNLNKLETPESKAALEEAEADYEGLLAARVRHREILYGESSYKKYLKLHGEAEARATEQRKNMPASTRRTNLPYMADRDPSSFIITMNESPVRVGSEGKSLYQWLSTRVPSAVSAKEDALMDELFIGLESMKEDRKSFEHNVELLTQYSSFRPEDMAGMDADQQAEYMMNFMADNLLWLHDQIPAEVRERSKLWYDGANIIANRWAEEYNLTEMQMSGVMAVLSPQKDWYQNADQARRVIDIMTNQQETVADDVMVALAQAKYEEALATKMKDAVKAVKKMPVHKNLGILQDQLSKAETALRSEQAKTRADITGLENRLSDAQAVLAEEFKKSNPKTVGKEKKVASAEKALAKGQEKEGKLDAARKEVRSLKGKYKRALAKAQPVIDAIYEKSTKGMTNYSPLIKGKKLGELEELPKAYWLRMFDETKNDRSYRIILPEGEIGGIAMTDEGEVATSAWGSTSEIFKAVSIFEDGSVENVHQRIGKMHKVRNFYNNIFSPMSDKGDVTIDTHAVAALLLRGLAGNDLEVSHNFGSAGSASSGVFGNKGTYGIMAEAYRRAAKARGLLPREMQSITWEAVRGLYTATFKANNKQLINDIWTQYESGEINLEQARAELLKEAGGINSPTWVGQTSLGEYGAGVHKRVLDQRKLATDPGSVDGGARGRAAGRPTGLGEDVQRTLEQDEESLLGQITFTGDIQKDETIISLFNGANASTLPHETAHFFLEIYSNLINTGEASETIRRDTDALLGWFGVDSVDQITTEHHELFADGFLKYLSEGSAPSPQMQNVFDRFASWLLEIYKTLKARNVPINDDVRAVMDQMLAGEAGRKYGMKMRGRAERDVGTNPVPPVPTGRPTYTDADLDSAREHIGDHGTPWADRWNALKARPDEIFKSWRQEWIQGIFDNFHGIKYALEKKGDDLPMEQDAYIAARLSRSVPDRLMVLLKYGQLKWEDGGLVKIDGTKGFLEVLDPISNNLDEFGMYLLGIRAKDLESEGITTGFTPAEINAMIGLGQTHSAFENVRQEYIKINQSVLDIAEDAGLIDPDARAMWENENYVPFYRIMDAGTVMPNGSGKGVTGASSGIHQIKGSERNIGDPIENIMMNWAHLMDAALKNHAALRAVDTLSDTSMTKAKRKFKPVMIPSESVKKRTEQLLEDAGIDPALGDLMSDAATLQGLTQLFSVEKPTGADVIQVMRDGKPEFWHVHDPLLFRAMTALNKENFGSWMSLFRFPKRLLTRMIVADPAFMARNYLRDTLSAWATSRDKYLPVVGTISGTVKAFRLDDDMVRMMAAGGVFSSGGYINANDPAEMKRFIKSEAKRAGFAKTLLSTPARMFRFWERLGSAIENSNRVAIAIAAEKSGKSLVGAAYEARDIMDFSMRGDYAIIQFLAESVPFFSARLQGIHRLGRGIHEDPTGIAIKGSMIMMASLALAMAYKDDERYKEMEEWDKDTYYHFWIGDDHYRLPKPFEIGVLFSTIPVRMMEAIIQDDVRMADFFDRLKWNLGESLSLNPTPQVVKPFMEQWANKSWFTKRPIVGMRLERLANEAQYQPWTSETMRFLGAKWDVSPIRAESLIRGYTGAIGLYMLQAADVVTRMATDYPAEPEKSWEEYPVLKSFFRGSSEPKNVKYMTELYDMNTELNKLAYTILEYRREDREADAVRIEDKHGERLKSRKTITHWTKEISDLRKEARSVHYDTGLTPKEKRNDLNILQGKINDAAKRGVEKAKEGGYTKP